MNDRKMKMTADGTVTAQEMTGLLKNVLNGICSDCSEAISVYAAIESGGDAVLSVGKNILLAATANCERWSSEALDELAKAESAGPIGEDWCMAFASRAMANMRLHGSELDAADSAVRKLWGIASAGETRGIRSAFAGMEGTDGGSGAALGRARSRRNSQAGSGHKAGSREVPGPGPSPGAAPGLAASVAPCSEPAAEPDCEVRDFVLPVTAPGLEISIASFVSPRSGGRPVRKAARGHAPGGRPVRKAARASGTVPVSGDGAEAGEMPVTGSGPGASAGTGAGKTPAAGSGSETSAGTACEDVRGPSSPSSAGGTVAGGDGGGTAGTPVRGRGCELAAYVGYSPETDARQCPVDRVFGLGDWFSREMSEWVRERTRCLNGLARMARTAGAERGKGAASRRAEVLP